MYKSLKHQVQEVLQCVPHHSASLKCHFIEKIPPRAKEKTKIQRWWAVLSEKEKACTDVRTAKWAYVSEAALRHFTL
jgi:hypothetical protein